MTVDGAANSNFSTRKHGQTASMIHDRDRKCSLFLLFFPIIALNIMNFICTVCLKFWGRDLQANYALKWKPCLIFVFNKRNSATFALIYFTFSWNKIKSPQIALQVLWKSCSKIKHFYFFIAKIIKKKDPGGTCLFPVWSTRNADLITCSLLLKFSAFKK